MSLTKSFLAAAALGCGLLAFQTPALAGDTIYSQSTQVGFDISYFYIAVRGGSKAAGTDLIQWIDTGTDEQRWTRFLYWGDPTSYQEQIVGQPELTTTRFRNKNSGMCITGGAAGSPLTQQPCDPNNRNQLWTWNFRDNHAGKGYQNLQTGLWMDVEGASLNRGARIISWYSNSAKNQLWGAVGWSRGISREDYVVNDTNPYIHYTTMSVVNQIQSNDPNIRNLGYQALQSGTGSWGYSAGRPAGFNDLKNDVHYTTVDNDAVYYAFTGSGISFVSEKSADEGAVDVYIDGVFKASVSGLRADVQNKGGQTLYNVTGLAADQQHTIVLVKKGGAYMLLDGFEVYP